jgi:hypothetical protein
MVVSFRLTAVCTALLISGVIPASGEQDCKPVTGRFEARIVPPGEGHCPAVANALCTEGRVWGGIQGNYEFVATGAIPSSTIGGVPTVVFFAGKSTVFLKNGEQVTGTDTGSLDLPPGQGGFASLITFGGGTGSMADATGQIRLRGELSAAAGTTSGDYVGSLCSQ